LADASKIPPPAGAVSARVKVGDDGPPKDAGIGSMTPIRRDPHGATPTSPLSADVRQKLADDFPEQARRVRELERRK
jgi:hypothetical protein